MKYKETFALRPSQIKIERIMLYLSQNRATVKEIAGVICAAHCTADRYTRHLRESGKIYICGYHSFKDKAGQDRHEAIYTIGDKPSAKMPVKDKAESARIRYHKMKKEEPAKYAAMIRRKIHYQQQQKFVPRPDIASAWVPKRNGG